MRKQSLSKEEIEGAERVGDTRASRLLVTNEGLLDPSLLIRTEGFMFKKGGAVNSRGGLKNWKKRWFVLAPVVLFDRTGYELQYLDGPDGNLKGTVGLSDVELFCESRSQHKKVKYEFQILLQNGGILQLSCDDAKEREEWIETLNIVIAYMRKILTTSAMTLDGYDPYFDDDETSYNIGEEIAQNCHAFGPGIFGSEAGKQSQFVVQIHDLQGQQATKGGMPVTATISNDSELYYLRVHDNGDGTYYAYYILGKKGKYQLSIRLNDEHHIFGSPFNVEVLPSRTTPKFCQAFGDSLTSVTANSSQTFTIVARDGYSNRKNGGGDPFEVGVMGPAQLKSLRDNEDGTYTCEIEVMSPSSVSYVSSASLVILVTLNGKHISCSPFKPIIIDDAIVTDSWSPAPSAYQPPFTTAASPLFGASMGSKAGRDDPFSSSTQYHDLNASSSPVPVPSPKGSIAGRSPVPPTDVARREEEAAAAAQAAAEEAAAAAQREAREKQREAALAALAATPMSRLERARQRALLAKALAEGENIEVPPPPPPTAAPLRMDGPMRPNAASMNRSNPSAVNATAPTPRSLFGTQSTAPPSQPESPVVPLQGANRLQQLAARNASQLNALKKAAATGPVVATPTSHILLTPQPSRPDSSYMEPRGSDVNPTALAQQLRQGLGGVSSTAPSSSSPEELRQWDATHAALSNMRVLEQLMNSADVLKQLFDTCADSVEGHSVVKLTTSSNGGIVRLLEVYDVIPSYLSKAETKALFTLIVYSQRNLRSPAASAGGGNALDFASFIKFLVMLSHYTLTKSTSLSGMYPTIESKIDVLLNKWGFADPVRLQVTRAAMNRGR